METLSKLKWCYYYNLRYFPSRRNSESPVRLTGGSKAIGCKVDNLTEDCISRNSYVAEILKGMYKTVGKCVGQVYVLLRCAYSEKKKEVSQSKCPNESEH